MPTTRPLKVFLCHASADKPAVRKLYRYLRSKGMDPWLDAEKLLPGESWEVEIPRAIFDSDVILVCLSKNSINKEGYVQKEIVFALDKAMEKPDGTIFIVPAKLEECDVPQRLNRYQWVDLYREDGRKRLMLSLNKRAAQLGPAVEQAVVADDTLERGKIELEEAKEKLTRENAEREAAAKAAREKTEREKAEKAKRERKVQSTVEKSVVTKTEPKKQLGTKLPFWGVGLTALAILTLIVWGLSSLPASPEATQTPSATQTLFVKSATKTPMPATSTATIIPTPTLGIGSTMTGEDGAILVYVPEGEFLMGSKDTDSPSYDDEKPQHSVTLDAFWIDQTEVTNKQYAACVSGAGCAPPSKTSSYTRSSYYGNTEFDEFPVIYVDWNQANDYCSWAGRELPTEAEWEKAARGTDARIYPWGNNTPNSTLLNYNVGNTTAVGNYQSGASLYGAYDMAGNVWEWVNDWYSETYYQDTNPLNPLGPESGQYRVLRGGSWLNLDNGVRSANRYRFDPAYTYVSFGFRCSRSP